MTEQKWDINPPKESGYYFATWSMNGDKRKKRVSEFWFDGRNWWTGRAYVQQEFFLQADYLGECVTALIVAWTSKPKPYKGSYDVEI